MVAYLARLLGSVFGLKYFMGTLLMTIIGVVLYNSTVGIIEEVMNFALGQISGAEIGTVSSPTVSGFAGWVLASMKLPECVSVIASFTALRFILRKIPFLRW